MMPQDPEKMAKIETKMALNKNDMTLKNEFEDCLKKCVCLELVQIKDFHMSKQGEDENQISSMVGDGQKGKVAQKHIEIRTCRGSNGTTEN